MLVTVAFKRHLQSFLGIKCFIRQFLASQDLIVDMIFEWLEFLVELQTEKNRKSTTKNRKLPKKTEKKPKNTEKKTKKTEKTERATANFKFGTGFFRFFWLATPPPPNLPHGQWSKKLTMTPSILPMVNGQIDQF